MKSNNEEIKDVKENIQERDKNSRKNEKNN